MKKRKGPSIALLETNERHSLQVATEVSQDLNARIIALGDTEKERLFKSKYCDEKYVLPDWDRDSVSSALNSLQPDLVLPTNYASTKLTDSIRNDLSDEIETALPPTKPLHTAFSKRDTLAVADDIGISIPKSYVISDEEDLESKANTFEYPLFLKPVHEIGGNLTAKVTTPAGFVSAFHSLEADSNDKMSILVQEYIGGDSYTYGCGALMSGGTAELAYTHTEKRSIPRTGGAGTRVRIEDIPDVREQALNLLTALNWDGIALVEFKKNKEGKYVLMEINPKFWASYSLPSKNGYRFASTLVANALDLDFDRNSRRSSCLRNEMVFPFREFRYYYENRDEESVLDSVTSQVWPPARIDVNLRDLRAWLPNPS